MGPPIVATQVSDRDAARAQAEGLQVFKAAVDGLVG